MAAPALPAVRPATYADVAPLARVLARAFEDDPVMAWMFPPARLLRRLERFFAMQLRRISIRHGLTLTTAEHLGGAVWLPPNHWRVRLGDVLRTMPTTVQVLGPRLPAALRALQFIEKHHPRDEHYYLAALGTHPHHQGRGVGGALLAPGLERCDAEGVPAYLESSKERNIPFYARHGFEVTGELALPGGGPPLWLMWREPRG